MDELNNQVEAIEEAEPETDLAGFDEAFDGTVVNDDFDLDADEAKADQPEAEEAAQPVEPVPVKEEATADQWFTLKHLDERKDVSREEVIALAQKGLDYDRIKEKLEQAKNSNEGYMRFLRSEAERNNTTLENYMESAMIKAELDGAKARGERMTPEQALQKVREDMKAKAEQEKTARLADEENAATARRMDSFKRFAQQFPDVKPESISKDVWDEFGEGKADLSDIYARHENKSLRAENAKLRDELETLKTNIKNTERTTGSRKTSGQATALDPFDEVFG